MFLMGYNGTRIDGIDATSIADIGGHMIATMDSDDLRKFCSANKIILRSYGSLSRWECILAIETAKSLQVNGDLGPYATRPMLALDEHGATIIISHFLVQNLASSTSYKISSFKSNKRASASMETPLFWEDCKKKDGDKHSTCERCGDWSSYECTLCNTTICCPVGKGNECFNEHHKSMHHELHDESERMATLEHHKTKRKCVVCREKLVYNRCSICGVNICGSKKSPSMICWHAHCKEVGHSHFIEQVYNGKQSKKSSK